MFHLIGIFQPSLDETTPNLLNAALLWIPLPWQELPCTAFKRYDQPGSHARMRYRNTIYSVKTCPFNEGDQQKKHSWHIRTPLLPTQSNDSECNKTTDKYSLKLNWQICQLSNQHRKSDCRNSFITTKVQFQVDKTYVLSNVQSTRDRITAQMEPHTR